MIHNVYPKRKLCPTWQVSILNRQASILNLLSSAERRKAACGLAPTPLGSGRQLTSLDAIPFAGPRVSTTYDTDFYAWANEQASLLRSGKLAEADIAHIAEEIESMGTPEKRELVNRLIVLLDICSKEKRNLTCADAAGA